MRSRLASLAVVTISSSSEETFAVVNSHERVTWLLLSYSFCKTFVWQIYKDTISVTIIAVYDLLFAKEESCTTQLAIWQLFVSVRWPKRWEQLLTSITTFRSKLVFFVPSLSSFVWCHWFQFVKCSQAWTISIPFDLFWFSGSEGFGFSIINLT